MEPEAIGESSFGVRLTRSAAVPHRRRFQDLRYVRLGLAGLGMPSPSWTMCSPWSILSSISLNLVLDSGAVDPRGCRGDVHFWCEPPPSVSVVEEESGSKEAEDKLDLDLFQMSYKFLRFEENNFFWIFDFSEPTL